MTNKKIKRKEEQENERIWKFCQKMGITVCCESDKKMADVLPRLLKELEEIVLKKFKLKNKFTNDVLLRAQDKVCYDIIKHRFFKNLRKYDKYDGYLKRNIHWSIGEICREQKRREKRLHKVEFAHIDQSKLCQTDTVKIEFDEINAKKYLCPHNLDGLTYFEQFVVFYKHVEEMTYNKIADRLSYTEKTIKIQNSNVKKKLQKMLKKEDGLEHNVAVLKSILTLLQYDNEAIEILSAMKSKRDFEHIEEEDVQRILEKIFWLEKRKEGKYE